jgi:GNAT superfamily N-acetyltransferase
LSDIEIRQARPADREAILAFCTETWDWGDYIAFVWEKWLNDPAGQLLVALSTEHPVGLVHVQMLNQTEAWLEGMRVDPAYRLQGIARQLNLEILAEAMRRGASTIRLITETRNTGSIHLVEQLHFQPVGLFSLYQAEPLTSVPAHNAGLEKLTLATSADLDEVIDYLNVSNIFPATGGLYYANFIAYRISDTLLREKIEAGSVYLLKRWNRLDGLAIAEPQLHHEQEQHFLCLGYIDGTTEAISLIAYSLRLQLATLGLSEIRAHVPDLMMLNDAFTGAEYTWNGNTFATYERSLV